MASTPSGKRRRATSGTCRQEGQHTHDRRQLGDLVQQQRIDEQRDEGDQRPGPGRCPARAAARHCQPAAAVRRTITLRRQERRAWSRRGNSRKAAAIPPPRPLPNWTRRRGGTCFPAAVENGRPYPPRVLPGQPDPGTAPRELRRSRQRRRCGRTRTCIAGATSAELDGGHQRVLTADDSQGAPARCWLEVPDSAGISRGDRDAFARSLVRQASPGRARNMADGARRRLPRPVCPGSHYATGTTLSGTPSAAAASLLQRAVPGQSGDTEQIVFETKTGTVNAPAVQKQIQTMLGRVSHLRYVSGVTSPYSPPGAKQISASKRIAFATVNFTQGRQPASRPPRRPSS